MFHTGVWTRHKHDGKHAFQCLFQNVAGFTLVRFDSGRQRKWRNERDVRSTPCMHGGGRLHSKQAQDQEVHLFASVLLLAWEDDHPYQVRRPRRRWKYWSLQILVERPRVLCQCGFAYHQMYRMLCSRASNSNEQCCYSYNIVYGQYRQHLSSKGCVLLHTGQPPIRTLVMSSTLTYTVKTG